MSTPRPTAPSSYPLVALVAGLAVITATLLIPRVSLRTSPTADEAAHLSAGVASVQTGDYRLNPEHPPLLKTLAALPLVLAGVEAPVDSRAWDRADIWRFGDAFLTARGEAARWWLALGRVVPLLLALALVGFVAAWGTRLHGAWGGLLSGGLAALDPTLVGHGGLVTNDVSFALTWLLAVAAFVGLREHNTLRRRLLAGLALGVALSTKFSALLLVPLLPAVVFWPATLDRPSLHALVLDWRRVLGTGLSVLAVATGVVTLVYEGNTGLWFQGLHVMRGGAEAYFLGERSGKGFLLYFVVALALKVPLSAWLGALLGARGLVTGPPATTRALRSLVAAAALFLLAASLARLNIGERHVMPVHATLWLLAGGAAPALGHLHRAAAPLLAAGLLGWAGIDLARAWVAPISAINPVAGGIPACGRYLGDSNCDWGQGLVALAEWQRENAPDGFYLAYFGNADPAAWGVRAAPLPAYGPLDGREPRALPSPTGWPRLLVVVSTSNLQGLGLDGLDLYRWLAEREPIALVGGSLHVFDLSAAADRRQLAEACRRAKWRRTASAIERWWPPAS